MVVLGGGCCCCCVVVAVMVVVVVVAVDGGGCGCCCVVVVVVGGGCGCCGGGRVALCWSVFAVLLGLWLLLLVGGFVLDCHCDCVGLVSAVSFCFAGFYAPMI